MTELNTELFDLTMSEKAKPLFERVKKHLEENVAPWQEEFEALNKEKTDRWTWHPRQLELLEGAKAKRARRGCGTSSCRMPRRARGSAISTMPISRRNSASIRRALKR